MQHMAEDEWPSTLMVCLVDYYGGTCTVSIDQQGSVTSETTRKGKKNRLPIVEGKDYQAEAHQILEFVVA